MASTDDPSGVFIFGSFQVDQRRRVVLREGRTIPIGGRAFELLLALVRSPGVSLRRDELIREAWPGRVVEKNTLNVQISAVRRALAPDCWLVATVPGHGYRFAGNVQRLVATQGWPKAGVINPGFVLRSSDMVGRDEELAQALRLVGAHRVVTITGPGGCGKTAFARELVRQLANKFSDGGVHAVELERMSDETQVTEAVTVSFGLYVSAAEVSCELLHSTIGQRHALLLLDGCDHIIRGAARVAAVAGRTGSALTVISTCREPIAVEGEAVFRLGSLSIPAEGAADTSDLLSAGSVQLFVARALAVEPRFSLDETSLSLIGAICRHLDGNPLAIEMAAAKSAVFGTRWVASRLDDRLTVLRHALRTSAPRQQTLEAMLDWSYELLGEADRKLLQMLSFFQGEFSLQAAKEVADSHRLVQVDVGEGLRRLVDKSLVMLNSSGGTARYRLLETTRIFALKKVATRRINLLQQ